MKRCLSPWACVMVAISVLLPTAQAAPWQAPAGATQIPLWPQSMSIEVPEVRGEESVLPGSTQVAGQPWEKVVDVTRPTMTVFPPKGRSTGAAVVVFPGGGYNVLAIDLEGTEVCDWLTAKGITCVVLKYRVPGAGPNWNQACNCRRIPQVPMALQDAQRAIGLLRQRANALQIDPGRIGVLGFSAGGHLVAAVSNQATRSYTPIDAADHLSSRPDFAVALYPGHLWAGADRRLEGNLELAPDIRVSADTPPTFLLQASDDPIDDVRHSLVYYLALRKAGVPTELHLFARGGHAFGLRPIDAPITIWPTLVETWMASVGALAKAP